MRVGEIGFRGGEAEGQRNQRRDRHAVGRGAGAKLGAGLLREDDVEPPAAAGGEREQHARRIEPTADIGERRKQHDPGDRQHHPDEVEQTHGAQRRDEKRPGEFERDADAQRNALERGIEEQVHARNGDAIGGKPGQPFARWQHLPRPQHRGQHQRADGKPQHRGALRAEDREQALGEGGAHLH